MSKTNKELVSELTTNFINSWNSTEKVQPIRVDDIKSVFNTFKKLVESMDDKETK